MYSSLMKLGPNDSVQLDIEDAFNYNKPNSKTCPFFFFLYLQHTFTALQDSILFVPIV